MLVLVASSCVESYEPGIELNASYIVVTGGISDISATSVKVERTVAINTNDLSTGSEVNEAITGLQITLYDEDGPQEVLLDQGDGNYAGVSVGVVGRAYHIQILMPNGDQIVSSPQTLKPGPEVADLLLEQFTELEQVGNNEIGVDGLNLNLYMNQSEVISHYYKWTLHGTYEFQAPAVPGFSCYVNDGYFGFFGLAESISSDKDLFSKRLIFLEPNGRKFSIGYSIEVSQYTMTDDAYNYWKKIDDQQNNVGSVFDSPPARIEGNLSYSDKEETILGFFEVNSIRKKRLFINPTDFAESPILATAACAPEKLNPPDWCSDCTALPSSTSKKPIFWP